MPNREILFRGKWIDTGEWVYGSLVIWPDKIHSIASGYCDEPFYEVDQHTVGQYTGLKDKNGTMIFESDIVRIKVNQDVEDYKDVDYKAIIAFLDGGFCAIDGTIEEHGCRRYALERMDFFLEVIGNIHDNMELMEVS